MAKADNRTAPDSSARAGADPHRAGGRPPRSAVRARLAVSLLQVIMGMTIGNWTSRLPDVRRAVGVDDAAWGLANSVGTVGAIVALSIVFVLIGRVSTRRLSLAGAWLILINAPLLASSSTVVAVAVGLVVWNFAATLLATPMGAQAVHVQRQYGRPLLATFTAYFSLGVFAGGVLGIFATAVGIAPGVQHAISSGILGALLLVSGRWLPDEQEPRAVDGARPRRVRDRFTPQLRLIAVMAFLSAFIASVAAGWSAIYTAETLGAGATLGAATVTGMSIASTLALLAGDWVTARVGRMRFFRASTVIAAAGLGLALAIGFPAVALIGFVILALGTACIDPIINGFAGDQPELTAGEGVSVVELGQLPGSLIAPALIGILASATGLRAALVAAIVAILALAILAGRIRVQPDDEVALA